MRKSKIEWIPLERDGVLSRDIPNGIKELERRITILENRGYIIGEIIPVTKAATSPEKTDIRGKVERPSVVASFTDGFIIRAYKED